MFELPLILCAIIAFWICLLDWRKGIFVCILVGFLQDPIRKMVPGQPVYFVVLIGVFVAATVIGAKMKRVPLKMLPIHRWYGVLRRPLRLFAVIVTIQAGVTLIRFSSPTLAGIGFLTYFAPIPALLLSYYYARNLQNIEEFLRFYVYSAFAVSLGILLSLLGYDWALLRPVGEELYVTVPGMALYAHQGFMRSSEIAAWHAATASCFVLILATMPGAKKRALAGLVIAGLLTAVIITGRRKMLVETVLFASFYFCLLIQARRGAIRLAFFILIIGIFLSIGTTLYSTEPSDQTRDYLVKHNLNPYVERETTAFPEARERFQKLGLSSVYWAIQNTGIWGAGAGVGSPGSQHFGGGWEAGGGAIEGGLGRITAELGILGLGLALWMGVATFRYLIRIYKSLKGCDFKLVTLTYGLIAFLAANVPVYIVAAPAYGDLFILLMLGWIMGFVFAIPRLISSIETGSPMKPVAPSLYRPAKRT